MLDVAQDASMNGSVATDSMTIRLHLRGMAVDHQLEGPSPVRRVQRPTRSTDKDRAGPQP